MAIRIDWDKYEVALLIEACLQVLNNEKTKHAAVAELSDALRERALNSGIEIDKIFRNRNGISLQMTKMDYLLTDGETGLPGASKLYVEIESLYETNPTEFAKILKAAKEQIGQETSEEVVVIDIKSKFINWLSSNTPNKFTPVQIINALNEGSDYCCSHGISKLSFWDTDIPTLTAITTKLLQMRLFRLTHRKTASILDKAVPLYKEFLYDQNTTVKAAANITTAISSSNKEKDTPEKEITYNTDLSYQKDDSDTEIKKKLDNITNILFQRYKINQTQM